MCSSIGQLKDIHAQSSRQVIFSVVRETLHGNHIRVVGSIAALGDWDPTCGLTLSTDASSYPKWSGSMALSSQAPASDAIEYKFVDVSEDGSTAWEMRSNREVRAYGTGIIDLGTAQFGEEVDITPRSYTRSQDVVDVLTLIGKSQPESTSTTNGVHPVVKENGMKKTLGSTTNGGYTGAGVKDDLPQPAQRVDSNEKGKGTLASTPPVADSPRRPGLRRGGVRTRSSPNLLTIAAEADADDEGDMGPRRPQLAEEGQSILITVPGFTKSVVVVFKGDGPKIPLQKSGSEVVAASTQSACWAVPFAGTMLKPGVYCFHFLVDDVRTLSSLHSKNGNENVALFCGQARKYIRSRLCAQDVFMEKPVSWGRGMSVGNCGVTSPKGNTPMPRPRSIGHNLASMADSADEGDATWDDEVPYVPLTDTLPPEVFEGLYDRELRLRLYGFTLPEPTGAPSSLRLRPGAHQLTKPFASECEDAYFVDDYAMGVADGVGGMKQFKSWGVNSAEYSAQLMACAAASLRPGGAAAAPTASPEKRALAAAVAAEENATGFGASTIGVLALISSTIGYANLGDSGFMVLRQSTDGMAVVKRSEEQQHGWNFPYQLTRLPPALAARFPQLKADHAAESNLYTCEVHAGDLILAFSDGLHDNLHEREILDIVDCALSPAFGELIGLAAHATPAEAIAKSLVLAAKVRSQDQLAKVPFYHYSRKHGYDHPGGKEDDITVVAAWVTPESEPDAFG